MAVGALASPERRRGEGPASDAAIASFEASRVEAWNEVVASLTEQWLLPYVTGQINDRIEPSYATELGTIATAGLGDPLQTRLEVHTAARAVVEQRLRMWRGEASGSPVHGGPARPRCFARCAARNRPTTAARSCPSWPQRQCATKRVTSCFTCSASCAKRCWPRRAFRSRRSERRVLSLRPRACVERSPSRDGDAPARPRRCGASDHARPGRSRRSAQGRRASGGDPLPADLHRRVGRFADRAGGRAQFEEVRAWPARRSRSGRDRSLSELPELGGRRQEGYWSWWPLTSWTRSPPRGGEPVPQRHQGLFGARECFFLLSVSEEA